MHVYVLARVSRQANSAHRSAAIGEPAVVPKIVFPINSKKKTLHDGVVRFPEEFQTASQQQHEIWTPTSMRSVCLGNDATCHLHENCKSPAQNLPQAVVPASFKSFAEAIPHTSLIAKKRLNWPAVSASSAAARKTFLDQRQPKSK